MTRPGWFTPMASVITLSLILMPTIGWAHHPMAQPGQSIEPPGILFWLVGVGVFIAVFVVTWALLSYFERQQRGNPGEQQSSRRLP